MTIRYCYDDTAKRRMASKYRTGLRKVAKALGLDKADYDLRFNPGGIAVWGEVTLHTDTLYVQVSHGHDLGILARTCKGRKDYTGGTNHWLPMALINRPEQLAEALLRIAPKVASWVIRNKATGEVMLETFDANVVRHLNTAKYEAVPVGAYLASLNNRSAA